MLTFKAMTMVDPAINFIEIQPIIDSTAKIGLAAVENGWLSRYPRPLKINTDGGPEFGELFPSTIRNLGIKCASLTARNPQCNSMIKRTHQAIGQVLRAVCRTRDPKSVHEGQAVIAETLATAMHAHNSSAQSALMHLSPGLLAFQRDMFLDIPLRADMITLQQHRQGLVDKRLIRANAKRISHDYVIGDQVHKKNYLGLLDKLTPTCSGPYPITRVHTNGTVTIQLSPHVFVRLNIRRIKPKFGPLAQAQP